MKPLKIHLTALIIMTLAVAINICNDVIAQTSVAIGAKAGASFSGFRGDDAGKIDTRKGLAGGLFVNISPVPFFSIQPELLLQQKGAVNKNDDFNFREDVKIGYFNLPVLAKLRLPIREKFFPHIYAGPQFSYAFKSSYSVSALDAATINREVDLRRYDLSGVFGFGLDIELKHLFLTGDFRYGMGGINLDENTNLKNQDISVMCGIGYKF